MQDMAVTNLSPVDGRYAGALAALRPLLSEWALIRTRVEVEFRWLVALLEEPALGAGGVSDDDRAWIDATIDTFGPAEAAEVKAIERTTNHDVKAVEYWMRNRISTRPGLAKHGEWIHFACTSEDINNLAWTLMVKRSLTEVVVPSVVDVASTLRGFAEAWADQPMMSRTHGQPATPTTLGKEMANVVARLDRQVATLLAIELGGKANGATGNYSAHVAAAPEVDWPTFSERFVRGLGLGFLRWTTQIEPHDQLAEVFDALERLNTILIDLDRDVWGYISLGYFRQRVVKGEVGSSTMPHKVNPIDFENSEGNAGVANALLGHMARKLPVSRWQRDLTDSTVLRSIGVAFGHTVLAWKACAKGLGKLELDATRLAADLDDAWELLAEPVQTVMRRYGVPMAYERLKDASRGRRMTRDDLHTLIHSLDEVPVEARERLLAMTPSTYLGVASELARALQDDRAVKG